MNKNLTKRKQNTILFGILVCCFLLVGCLSIVMQKEIRAEAETISIDQIEITASTNVIYKKAASISDFSVPQDASYEIAGLVYYNANGNSLDESSELDSYETYTIVIVVTPKNNSTCYFNESNLNIYINGIKQMGGAIDEETVSLAQTFVPSAHAGDIMIMHSFSSPLIEKHIDSINISARIDSIYSMAALASDFVVPQDAKYDIAEVIYMDGQNNVIEESTELQAGKTYVTYMVLETIGDAYYFDKDNLSVYLNEEKQNWEYVTDSNLSTLQNKLKTVNISEGNVLILHEFKAISLISNIDIEFPSIILYNAPAGVEDYVVPKAAKYSVKAVKYLEFNLDLLENDFENAKLASELIENRIYMPFVALTPKEYAEFVTTYDDDSESYEYGGTINGETDYRDYLIDTLEDIEEVTEIFEMQLEKGDIIILGDIFVATSIKEDFLEEVELSFDKPIRGEMEANKVILKTADESKCYVDQLCFLDDAYNHVDIFEEEETYICFALVKCTDPSFGFKGELTEDEDGFTMSIYQNIAIAGIVDTELKGICIEDYVFLVTYSSAYRSPLGYFDDLAIGDMVVFFVVVAQEAQAETKNYVDNVSITANTDVIYSCATATSDFVVPQGVNYTIKEVVYVDEQNNIIDESDKLQEGETYLIYIVLKTTSGSYLNTYYFDEDNLKINLNDKNQDWVYVYNSNLGIIRRDLDTANININDVILLHEFTAISLEIKDIEIEFPSTILYDEPDDVEDYVVPEAAKYSIKAVRYIDFNLLAEKGLCEECYVSELIENRLYVPCVVLTPNEYFSFVTAYDEDEEIHKYAGKINGITDYEDILVGVEFIEESEVMWGIHFEEGDILIGGIPCVTTSNKNEYSEEIELSFDKKIRGEESASAIDLQTADESKCYVDQFFFVDKNNDLIDTFVTGEEYTCHALVKCTDSTFGFKGELTEDEDGFTMSIYQNIAILGTVDMELIGICIDDYAFWATYSSAYGPMFESQFGYFDNIVIGDMVVLIKVVAQVNPIDITNVTVQFPDRFIVGTETKTGDFKVDEKDGYTVKSVVCYECILDEDGHYSRSELSAIFEKGKFYTMIMVLSPKEGYEFVIPLDSAQDNVYGYDKCAKAEVVYFVDDKNKYNISEDGIGILFIVEPEEAIVYNINTPKAENGAYLVDQESAISDTIINIKTEAQAGYELEEIIVKDANGEKITVENNSFVMPESEVTIEVKFKATEA